MTDWKKIRYVIRFVALYWLGVAGGVAVIYGLYRLSKLFTNPVIFEQLIVFLMLTAFLAWIGAKTYKVTAESKRREEEWAAQRKKFEAEQAEWGARRVSGK